MGPVGVGGNKTRWKTLQKVSIGDHFICYLTGVPRFVGILEVTADPFKNYEHDIWKDEDFPCRFEVKPVVELTPETAIPVKNLSDQLSFFQNQKSPHGWTGHFRSSPAKWKESDGEAVLQALLEAKENPVKRPVDKRKLNYRPAALRSKFGSVTVPQSEETTPHPSPTEHTEMQWVLLKLGADMGFDLWVVRNDRGRDFNG